MTVAVRQPSGDSHHEGLLLAALAFLLLLRLLLIFLVVGLLFVDDIFGFGAVVALG